jgi:tetratricopeptide (TPR) repeat protein
LNRLLETALDLAADQREAWLAALPADSTALLPLLRRLLHTQAHPETSTGDSSMGMLDRAHLADFARNTSHVADQAGDRIGPYRLVRVLGEGGMATVWLAERADRAMQRSVALKIPHSEWADRGLADRISRECSVLASLNHPNIAHLYDAGWSEKGRPYLALEVVEGETIDVSCRERNLPVRDKVRLFIDVLRAVAYAHVRLVVHRDLKPANVLVTGAGQVKLLDFGIAKVLASDSRSVVETELTRSAGRPLTFAYAAPEQFLGEAVTTATDIYSLGVMLFELLSGERPYRTQRDSRTAIEDAIVRADPPVPSNFAKDRALARALRGDLDTICLKALQKNPDRRYETAAAFADDLERYLDGRAVHARRDSGWYRAGRFLSRNRLAVGASLAVVAALTAGLTVAVWQGARAREAAQNAERVNGFMLAVIQQADPNASRQTKASDRALLKTFEDRIDRELSDRPDLQLPMRLAIATAYRNRDENADSASVLRRTIAQAQGLYPITDWDLLRAHVLLGQVSTDDREIRQTLDPAIQTLRGLGSPGIPLLVDALTARSEMGGFSDPERFVIDAREAFETSRRSLGLDDEHTVRAANRLAQLLGPGVLNRDSEALAVLEPVVQTGRASTRLPSTHPLMVRAMALYGEVLCWLDRDREGMPLLERNLRIAIEQHQNGQPTVAALWMLASGQMAAGKGEAALATYVSLYALLAQSEPYASLQRYRNGSAVAYAMIQSGRPLEAEPFIDEGYAYRQTLDTGEKSTADRADLRNGFERVGSLLGLGEYERARTVGQALRQRFLHDKSMNYVRQIDFYLADALVATGRLREADEVSQEQLRIIEETNEAGTDMRSFLVGPARVKLAMGDAQQALAITDQAAPAERNHPLRGDAAAQNSDLANYFLVRGRALLALHRPQDALEPLQWAYAIWNAQAPAHHATLVARYWYARALDQTGSHEQARGLQEAGTAAPVDYPAPDAALLRRERAKGPQQRIDEVVARYRIRPEVSELIARLNEDAAP